MIYKLFGKITLNYIIILIIFLLFPLVINQNKLMFTHFFLVSPLNHMLALALPLIALINCLSLFKLKLFNKNASICVIGITILSSVIYFSNIGEVMELYEVYKPENNIKLLNLEMMILQSVNLAFFVSLLLMNNFKNRPNNI